MPGAGAISSCYAAGNADDSASRALGEGAAGDGPDGDGPDGDEAAAAPGGCASTPEVLKQEQTSARITVDKGRQLDVVDKCRQFDEDVAAAFRRGDIRLLHRAWVLDAPDQHLPFRQVLEERECQGESPLLGREEAAVRLERGDRSIGALTHPWYSPGDPDPAGVKLKILREALLVLTHIEAIFVDYASLFQHPPKGTRTDPENEAFKRALGVMGDVYASAVGTTVLQIKEIPPCPQEFDGALCLFALKAGVDEAAIRQALSGDLSSEFESCDLAFESSYGIVRFTTHAAALRAKEADAFSELCGGVDTRYNERSYDGRGWCCLESGVSGELLARLSVYPRMKAALDELPPKMLSLASGRAPEQVQLLDGDVGKRVQRVIESIQRATFTGKGDKDTVPALYKSYIDRVATVLTSTLALQAAPSRTAFSWKLDSMPSVKVPPAAPLRLASGQLLLVLQGGDAARSAGGQGDGSIGVVGQDGRVSFTLADGGADVDYDLCVQAVLPWRAGGGDGTALLRNVEALPALAESARRLHANVLALGTQSRKEQLMTVRKDAERVGKKMALTPLRREAALTAAVAIRSSADAAVKARGSNEAASKLEAVQAAVKQLTFDPEAVAGAALLSSGTVGTRRYAAGQRLTVLNGGSWREAEVLTAGPEHVLRIDTGQEVSLQLHPWNHAPRELPLDDFEALREWWAESLRAQHSFIPDALTGTLLDALEQCVAIKVMGNDQLTGIRDVRGLSEWLHSLHSARLYSKDTSEVTAALLTAPAASGKTTLISQAVVLALGSAKLVAIVIKVQLLQARLLEAPDAFASSWNWVDAYLCLVHTEQPALYRMLRQALKARRALLLIDGLDEAGSTRTEIERHIVEVLAPQGHVMLCTSRPAGVDEKRFAGFHRLQLAPLTEAQQCQALTQRLRSAGKVEALMPFVNRMPKDVNTQERVTANPLMLSMVASVFELRQGVDMPKTVAELYEIASEAMQARGGAVSAELRKLLEAILFEAHAAQVRVIPEALLYRAALGVFGPEGALAEYDQQYTDPFKAFEGRAEEGHYVEVLRGDWKGQHGVICQDDKDSKPYKVKLADRHRPDQQTLLAAIGPRGA